MLTFNLKTTFFTVKTSNEVYCCRIYSVNYIQNVHIINRTLHGSLEDMDFMFSWQEQYLTRSLRSLVRYCSCHSNIKSISSRNRVISYMYSIHSCPYFYFGNGGIKFQTLGRGEGGGDTIDGLVIKTFKIIFNKSLKNIS